MKELLRIAFSAFEKFDFISISALSLYTNMEEWSLFRPQAFYRISCGGFYGLKAYGK